MAAETEAVCSVLSSLPFPLHYFFVQQGKGNCSPICSLPLSHSLYTLPITRPVYPCLLCVFLLNSYYYPGHYYYCCRCRLSQISFSIYIVVLYLYMYRSFFSAVKLPLLYGRLFLSTCLFILLRLRPSLFLALCCPCTFVLLIVCLYYDCRCHCSLSLLLLFSQLLPLSLSLSLPLPCNSSF